VRIGNAAAGQFQLDVYGEVLSALYESVQPDDPEAAAAWELQLSLLSFLESGWREPDDGIWEVRGPRRHFTHSKVMAWVAFDSAIKTVEDYGMPGPVDHWRDIRQEIHDQVCEHGFNAERGSFTQYYGSDQLDASLLMMPLVGFLPATDPRVRATIEAIEADLMDGDFVLRYRTTDTGAVDGLTGTEGAFLACSFWLADCLSLLGRDQDARDLLERLLDLRNDLGLLSEEYDAVAGRLVGNFPQAFSHVSLVNSAAKIAGHHKPSVEHVFRGLARQSLTSSRPTVLARHRLTVRRDGPAARDAVARIAARAAADAPTPARPTRKRSVQRLVPRKDPSDPVVAPTTRADAARAEQGAEPVAGTAPEDRR
jgi:GH15 family glucan-1,4-alpha-glucosidase